MMIPALEHDSSQYGPGFNLAAYFIPEVVFIVVNELLEDGSSCLGGWLFVMGDIVHAEVVFDYVRHGLCVRSRA